jgi:hypothetical protein
MTSNPENPRLFDPLAFTLALVLAPFLSALLFCWVLLIPVGALIGMPVYLISATPLLLVLVGRAPLTFWHFAMAGFALEVALFVMANLLHHAWKPAPDLLIFLGFGLPIAPLWTGMFARLYSRFYNPVYRVM